MRGVGLPISDRQHLRMRQRLSTTRAGNWHTFTTMIGAVAVVLFLLSLLRPGLPLTLRTPISAEVMGGVASDSIDKQHGKLKLVQVVFRHGARTPLNTLYWRDLKWPHCKVQYPGVELQLYDENGSHEPPPILDKDEPVLPGGCKMGQLTETGYGMATTLGSWLRSRYVDDLGFLPQKYQTADVYLRTTAIGRTVATLTGVFTGLYPGVTGPLQVAASHEGWEIMYAKNDTCPKLGPIQLELAEKLAEQDARDPELPRLATRVLEAFSLPATEPLLWTKLYDVLAAMKAENRTVPGTADPEIMDIVFQQASHHESSIIAPIEKQGLLPKHRCHEALMLGIGPLPWRLIDNMHTAMDHTTGRAARSVSDVSKDVSKEPLNQAAQEHGEVGEAGWKPKVTGLGRKYISRGSRSVKRVLRGGTDGLAGDSGNSSSVSSSSRSGLEQQTPRLYLYSGHDSSVYPLLAMLGDTQLHWPPFASNIVMELWELKGGRPWVRLLYNREPLQIKHGDADGWISLDQLEHKVLAPYLVSDQKHHDICREDHDLL